MHFKQFRNSRADIGKALRQLDRHGPRPRPANFRDEATFRVGWPIP
jgi:hypothetical protein